MKTKFIVRLEYDNDWVWSSGGGIEAIYDNELAYFDKEAVLLFEKMFGFSVFEYGGKYIEDDSMQEDIEEFIEDNKKYPKQVAPGIYCEDMYSKDELVELEEKEVIFFWRDLEYATKYADLEFDRYYIYWDGSNYECKKIEEIYEVLVEHTHTFRGDTYSEIYYKDKNGAEIVVYSSMYQGSLDVIDEEKCDINKIIANAE